MHANLYAEMINVWISLLECYVNVKDVKGYFVHDNIRILFYG